MPDIEKTLDKMRASPFNVRFTDLCKVCDHYFGEPRQKGTSHRIFKVPWISPPLINIQNFNSKAKEYQVRQVLAAIDKMEKQK